MCAADVQLQLKDLGLLAWVGKGPVAGIDGQRVCGRECDWHRWLKYVCEERWWGGSRGVRLRLSRGEEWPAGMGGRAGCWVFEDRLLQVSS